MNSFFLALQFLTVIPLKIKGVTEEKLARATLYFPLVGLLIGLVLAQINLGLFILNFPSLAISIILIVFLVGLTGGLHLDGLSDSADAFLSGRSKEEMLNIMRDPHTGVMGVLSIICAILLKIGLLYSLPTPARTSALLLMCVLSRWSAVLAMFAFAYARQEGKAGVFIRGITPKIFLVSLISAFIFALVIWQLKGLIALAIVSGCAYLSGSFTNRRIGGITGDTLGATIELTEIAVLLIFCIL
ncbi:MAG: adenosylcobinamide-GDP ribazoletransferase [Candidatus Omnitrophica bacterium]|nr:adenosylcobinamide-GDP ribazoletransferase [Candidatus Omnitrophota bacterium]MDD5661714.1 adenosylcobinamide-GDP ribazoletransferase [Candidatus Omnitrophota bacterium]